jgi:hypothetical protein
MIKLMVGISASALLSTVALAQADKNIPARPDPSATDQTAGSKVAPVPAPDASTQAGQERGNAQILEQSQQNTPGTGGTSKPGVPGEPGTKSGSTVAPDDKDQQSDTSQSNAIQQDQSKVPGMKGNKSGEAPK